MTVGRPRKALEAAEQYLGPQEPFQVDEIGSGVNIEIVERPLTGDKVATERFMNEKLTIIVHDSNDDADDPWVPTWVNGRCQMFRRGVEQLVRRCFVESLARSTRTTYKQFQSAPGPRAGWIGSPFARVPAVVRVSIRTRPEGRVNRHKR